MPFGLLSIDSEQICAYKKVREGWAEDLALPLPQELLYLYVATSEGSEKLSLRARN